MKKNTSFLRMVLTVALFAVIGLAILILRGASAQPGEQRRESLSMADRLAQYATVRLTTDMHALTENERRMIPLLIEAARQMDDAFWIQAYGDRDELMANVPDAETRQHVAYNYGPWDRLRGNEPFVDGVGAKPAGANFYPKDMTKAEFEKFLSDYPDQADTYKNLYTMIRRNDQGRLIAVPYHEFFHQQVTSAAEKLREAAALAEDAGLKKYIYLRAEALLNDDYQPSDMAWLDMKNNTIDVVIGPIETYEDQLFGYKASFEAYILIKDKKWSRRLSKYAALLPGLQRGLPVDDAYKREMPGTDSDLNAYDVLYYAGDCNAGSKTIAINLPNDEEVQLKKGTRRLQLKNTMRAKYDKILLPIADVLIARDQRQHITFQAFFANTMFHEVAHGLGIKNTIDGKGTVREALKEQASALEEGKADILGLYMVTKLFEQGELTEGAVMDNYVTFLAGIFRSVRFGASSAHGRANMLRFNFFKKMNAFSRDPHTGRYRVNVDRFQQAVAALSSKILKLQGDGDYNGVQSLMAEMGGIGPQLQSDLDRLDRAGIAVDVVFEQGMSVLP